MPQPVEDRPKIVSANVTEETWRAARDAASAQGESVSRYIERLLEKDLVALGFNLESGERTETEVTENEESEADA
jgi:hypothetical protein